eukprot:2726348-Prymnesium_polylepis.1
MAPSLKQLDQGQVPLKRNRSSKQKKAIERQVTTARDELLKGVDPTHSLNLEAMEDLPPPVVEAAEDFEKRAHRLVRQGDAAMMAVKQD